MFFLPGLYIFLSLTVLLYFKNLSFMMYKPQSIVRLLFVLAVLMEYLIIRSIVLSLFA